MTIEQKLKNLILDRYKSIREFSIKIGMPYSTLDSIFKRGISNANINNIFRNRIELRPENPTFEVLNYENEEMENIKILGKAILFLSNVR